MIVVLENIRSTYNVGSILRTCAFLGIKQVALVGYSGREKPGENKLHDKVLKTALGAEKDVKLLWFDHSNNWTIWVKKKKLKLVAVEQDKKSISLVDWKPSKNMALVFGNEIDGVSKEVLEVAEEIVEIPRLGNKSSLNVTIAAGMVLWRATS